MSMMPTLLVCLLALSPLLGCGGPRRALAPPTRAPARCALIVTDDDIPSGSATAGALYVGEDELGRRLLTSDVLAVAAGFRRAGLCVEVADSHHGAIDRARLAARGIPLHTPADKARWRLPFVGVHGPRYRVSALVGFHARAGLAQGFRPHTVNDHVRGARIDDRPVGEVGMMMAWLAALGTPVVLVTGDQAAADEARQRAPGIEAVSVRWRRADGAVGFLREGEAPAVLERAARRAAGRAPRLALAFPAQLAVEAHSQRRAEQALRQVAEARVLLERLLRELGHPPYRLAPRRDGLELRWVAPDALVAALSFFVVASSSMPRATRRAWDEVDKGIRAFEAGRHEEALAAYRRAIAADPDDPAHHCRVGNVLLARGELAAARAAFRRAVEELDAIIGHAMKTVCLGGLATALARSGESEGAAALWRRVLALPDHRGSRERARRALAGAKPQ